MIAAPTIEATIAPPSSPPDTMSSFVLGLDPEVLAAAAVPVLVEELVVELLWVVVADPSDVYGEVHMPFGCV